VVDEVAAAVERLVELVHLAEHPDEVTAAVEHVGMVQPGQPALEDVEARRGRLDEPPRPPVHLGERRPCLQRVPVVETQHPFLVGDDGLQPDLGLRRRPARRMAGATTKRARSVARWSGPLTRRR
jgi:hypothetical protein